jgi:hypothetical protein
MSWPEISRFFISGEIKLDLIYITPAPGFAGLDRFHDRVFHSVEVLCRMLVLRGIAAAHLPTYHALPQVNPSVSQFDALAAHSLGRFHVFNLVQVGALSHMYSS